jgi:biotin synthase
MTERERIEKLYESGCLPPEEYGPLIDERTPEDAEYLFSLARKRCHDVFGDSVYLRAIIEFSNYCASDCYYCGIRRSNGKAERYRMDRRSILDCAKRARSFGFRTVVLQSGEDPAFTDEEICAIVSDIRREIPDMAITLSIGEKSRESYQRYYDAGADRYLLRHETASFSLYKKLKPANQLLENRIRCLLDLKSIGYQVGAGMMLETPYQQTDDLVQDLLFLRELKPEMIGIGPFIPHRDTPFRDFPAGTVELCLFMLGILRLMFPEALIPATTALGTVDPKGREKGILAGANVIMPNVSPRENRGKYLLYDGKICTGEDAAMCSACMARRMTAIGRTISPSRGDAPGWERRRSG